VGQTGGVQFLAGAVAVMSKMFLQSVQLVGVACFSSGLESFLRSQ
jgi:hypothetical protein